MVSPSPFHLPLLNRAPRYLLDWLVPGLLRDKCVALIKGLPKALRKQLVPAPDVVDAALADLTPDDTDLCSALGKVLKRQRGVQVNPADWQMGQLEDFYRMNVRVVDVEGKLLGQGRDMAALVAEFRSDEGRSPYCPKNRPPRTAQCGAMGFWCVTRDVAIKGSGSRGGGASSTSR